MKLFSHGKKNYWLIEVKNANFKQHQWKCPKKNSREFPPPQENPKNFCSAFARGAPHYFGANFGRA